MGARNAILRVAVPICNTPSNMAEWRVTIVVAVVAAAVVVGMVVEIAAARGRGGGGCHNSGSVR